MKFTKTLIAFLIGLSGIVFSQIALAQNVKIGALVAGQITQVYVKKGETVKAGQTLMKIDSARIAAKLQAAKAEAELMRLVYADAQIELEQALDLYDRTVSSKRTLDAAQLAHDVAKQKHLKAAANVDYYQAWLKYTVIKSPINGSVKTIYAPKGSTVFKENSPLIEISP